MKLKNPQKGFTIIEVLIVLAIAAVILLVVFLAVPALQRNNRNTQYKNAAASILAAVNEYTANNNGAMPVWAGIESTSGNILLGDSSASNAAFGKTQAAYTVQQATNPPTTTGDFYLATNNKCNGNTVAAAKRAVAIVYLVETAAATTAQCTES